MDSVITLTLNPSIDSTIVVDNFIPEKKTYCSQPTYSPGGGGVNVARAITRLGANATAIYLSGGPNGDLLTQMLHDENVPVLPIPISGNTRENWMVINRFDNKQYRFIMPGPPLKKIAYDELLSTLRYIKNVSYIVVSGSMPPDTPLNIFDHIQEIALQKKAKLIVDTAGESLIRAVKNKAYMIKPNVNELATLIVSLGLKENSIKEAVQEIVSKGYCEVVVVSLGAAGAIFCDKDTCTEIKAPPTKKMSTVGAGDSLVAGIVYSLMNNKDLLSAVSFGVACGSAATKNSGTELFYPQDARNLFQIMNGELMNSFVKV